jgi:hypothetical protein
VLETTLSVRTFYVHVNTDGVSPMVYMPQTQSGGFFNDQERQVASQQWVEALSLSHKLGRGEHVFKAGIDVQRSQYDGFSLSRPVEIVASTVRWPSGRSLDRAPSRRRPAWSLRSSLRTVGISGPEPPWNWGCASIAIRSSNR